MAWSGSNQTDPTLFRISGVTYKLFDETTAPDIIEATLKQLRQNKVEPWLIHYPYIKQRYKEYCKIYKFCMVCGVVDHKSDMYNISKTFYCKDHKTEFEQDKIKLIESQNKTNLKKYGAARPAQCKEIVDKMRATTLEKYGVEVSTQRCITNFSDLNEDFVKRKFIEDGLFLIGDFRNYFSLGVKASNEYKRRFNITESNKTEKYKTQLYIFNNIKTENKLFNERTILDGLELDIYLPDQKLAVEYDGLMFHSQGIQAHPMFSGLDFDKNYHLNKTELCLENGIQLFHIFEGEDLDLWLSMINNKLGLSKRIFARKCTIKELNNKDVLDFLNENHIQGYCSAKINLGLYYNNELVQVMTFSKPRFNKNYEYELIRLCSLKNTTVVGGPSKLLNYFKKVYKPKSIISYANRRFSNGSIYEKLGFKFKSVSKPNYFYFKLKDLKLESRNKYQKHKLSNLLENFDPNLSELQNMFNNDYRRIFDCGNLVYELILN